MRGETSARKKKKMSKSRTPRTGLVISIRSASPRPHPPKTHTNQNKPKGQIRVAALLPSWQGCAFFCHDQSWGQGEKDEVKTTSCPWKSISSFHSNGDLAGTWLPRLEPHSQPVVAMLLNSLINGCGQGALCSFCFACLRVNLWCWTSVLSLSSLIRRACTAQLV